MKCTWEKKKKSYWKTKIKSMCYKPHLVLELTLPWKELRLCLCHSSHSLTFIRKWTPVIRRQWLSSFYKFDSYNPISKQKIATILNISVAPNGPGKGSQCVMYCSLSQKIFFIEIATKGKQDTLCELEQSTIKEKEITEVTVIMQDIYMENFMFQYVLEKKKH